MKQITKTIGLLAVVLASFQTETSAQVKFKLDRTGADTYIISLVPEQSLNKRQAITGTMQVTLRSLSAAGFVPGDLRSLQPGVDWDRGTFNKSPDGARSFDYFSVALSSIGTKLLRYEAGKAIPLFSVRNIGLPGASLILVNNVNDPLVNARQNTFNVSNHISVLGFGQRNAYSGNFGADVPGGSQVGIQQVFPNPAREKTTVEYVNYLNASEGAVLLKVVETGTGRALISQAETMSTGMNRAELNVSSLAAGSYILQLEQQGKQLGTTLRLVVVQ